MKYSEARKTIGSGDVILWRGTSLAARIVRFFTKSPWSHVGIAVHWGGRLMVFDCYPFKGTRLRPLSIDLKDAYWVRADAVWGERPLSYALKHLGRGYSWQNLWKTWLGLNLVRREFQCAQYAAEILTRAGLSLTHPATPKSIAFNLDADPVPIEQ